MGMIYAICSLGFAGVNDCVFKKYGQKVRPVGLLLALVGLVWTAFFMTIGALRGTLIFGFPVILIGTLAGLFSAMANILLVEGMKKTGASVAASIYRLNLVFVAILAFVLLKEPMGMLKVIGLLVAVVAVLLFSRWDESSGGTAMKFMLLLLLASFLRACMGISYKIASSCGSSDEVFLAVNGICWIVAGCVYSFIRERGMVVSQSVYKYGLISGILVCGIVLSLKQAVNRMDASIAVSVSQFSFMVTAPLAVCFMNEKLSIGKYFGIGLAALCIILFSFSK